MNKIGQFSGITPGTFLIFTVLMATSGALRADTDSTFWNIHSDTNPEVIDHDEWQLFLDRFVVTLSDGRTAVSYQSVDRAGHTLLASYILRMSKLDPTVLTRQEQMAFWVNLYNALTVKVVLEHPNETSITDMGKSLLSFGPWDEVAIIILGQDLTLNDIEHRILRPIWKDHRIHFALNCASVDCPNLSPTAYESVQLEDRLSFAEKIYLSHSRGMHFDDQGQLHLSSIFKWYLTDFAADERLLLIYLAQLRKDLAPRLSVYDDKIEYNYNWQLNSAP